MPATKTPARVSGVGNQPPAKANDQFDVGQDMIQYLKEYAREKPEVAALWCFGVGFIIGWKLKPW